MVSTVERGYAVIIAHCLYGPHSIRTINMHDIGHIDVPIPYLAAATIVQTGQALGCLLFRSDMPHDDLRLPFLVAKLFAITPALCSLMDEDPTRTAVIDPVDRGGPQLRIPSADACREVFLHAFLKHAAAGAA